MCSARNVQGTSMNALRPASLKCNDQRGLARSGWCQGIRNSGYANDSYVSSNPFEHESPNTTPYTVNPSHGRPTLTFSAGSVKRGKIRGESPLKQPNTTNTWNRKPYVYLYMCAYTYMRMCQCISVLCTNTLYTHIGIHIEYRHSAGLRSSPGTIGPEYTTRLEAMTFRSFEVVLLRRGLE